MKLSISALALLATLVAANQHKRYIVTYEPSTPDHVIEQAIVDAKLAGAQVTHQYQLIKGFSVDAPNEDADMFVKSLETAEHKAIVEEDQIVTTQGNHHVH